jgi:hypothetical protein
MVEQSMKSGFAGIAPRYLVSKPKISIKEIVMALIIAFVNKSNAAELSNYQADVYLNEHHIDGPFEVKGHKRSDGWQKLVKIFANGLKEEKHEPVRKVQNVRRRSQAR